MRPSEKLSSSRGVAPSPFDLLIAVLRDEPIPADLLQPDGASALVALARAHGVLPLAADRLARRTEFPPDLLDTFHVQARAAAALDLVLESELRQVVAGVAAAGMTPLLFKGAHLAYAYYPRPDLRPRVDTDLMIAERDRARVRDVLSGLGYEDSGQVSGGLVMSQACFVKRRGGQTSHAVDVHWRLANAQAFADVLTYEEMARASVPLPRLSPLARGLSDVHAMLVACIHRVAHHFDPMHLIWLYDIHLMAARLDEARWRECVALAGDRGVASVTRQSLLRAQRVFDCLIPSEVLAWLNESASARTEPSAVYVSLTPRSRSQWHVLVSDLRALPSWGRRWRLMREHLFPSVQYMREVYAPASRAPLYLLYAQRAVRGARKWIRV